MKFIIIIICSVLLILSCKTKEPFYNYPEGNLTSLKQKNFYTNIKPNDKLSVSIWDHNDLSLGSVYSIYNSNESFGKWVLVEADSTILLPKIGKIKLGGLTTIEAANTIKKSLGKFLIDPICHVKILNKEVNIIGEVKAPGKYLIDKEFNTIPDLISSSQGLLFYSRIDDIKLIRKDSSYVINLNEISPVDLNNINVIDGDIIYIPSKGGKIFDTKTQSLIPIASFITSLAVLFSLIQN